MLGLGSQSAAHEITEDTKFVLDHTSNRPNVPTELSKQVTASHRLQPGDAILLDVLEEGSKFRLPADQTVLPDGSIDLGPFGRIIVAAMSPEQAETTIQNVIIASGQAAAAVNVRVIQPSHRFYVVGEVNSPGSYQLVGNETVLDALMKAGGLTDQASACDILLARPTTPESCRVTLPVCYRAITQLGDTSTNYHLQPGDRILVAGQSKCEEIFSFLSLPFDCPNCENCSDATKACCDSNIATNPGSEFVPPVGTVYPATRPPQFQSSPSQTTPGSVAPQSNVRLLPPESLDNTRTPATPGFPSNAIDGELDFGEQFFAPRSPR